MSASGVVLTSIQTAAHDRFPPNAGDGCSAASVIDGLFSDLQREPADGHFWHKITVSCPAQKSPKLRAIQTC